jgi:AcrR family transcriptional regulator
MARTRSFDEDALLDAAIELFWVTGFGGSALGDLSRVTGVTNGSLYQAFGSKREIFLAAFRRYCGRRVAFIDGVFETTYDDPAAAAAAYIDAVVADCCSYPDRRGCLLVNTISELGSDPEIRAIAAETIGAMEDSVADGLRRAAGADVDVDRVRTVATHLVALSQGLVQLSRTGETPAALRRRGTPGVDAALALAA